MWHESRNGVDRARCHPPVRRAWPCSSRCLDKKRGLYTNLGSPMSQASHETIAETSVPGHVPMPKRKSSCQSCTAEASADRIDSMFKAFSDRTRLRLLHLLLRGESCVGDLVEVLQAPQPRVSRHLAYLRKAGMVRVRQAGLWKYYSLCPAQGVFHERLLECLGTCFSEVPELKADAARAKQLRKSGGCCPRG